jgi:hypothetical protein
MNSYPLPTLKQSIATRESVQLANLLKQYNVSSLRSLNNVDSAYVTRSTGTVRPYYLVSDLVGHIHASR